MRISRCAWILFQHQSLSTTAQQSYLADLLFQQLKHGAEQPVTAQEKRFSDLEQVRHPGTKVRPWQRRRLHPLCLLYFRN